MTWGLSNEERAERAEGARQRREHDEISRAMMRKWLGVPEASPVAPAAAPAPDAELIRLCDACIAALDASLRDPDLDCEDDPQWLAHKAAEAAALALPATTLAGLAAKARVAQRLARQRDGSLDLSDSFIGAWGEAIIQDVLALAGEPSA